MVRETKVENFNITNVSVTGPASDVPVGGLLDWGGGEGLLILGVGNQSGNGSVTLMWKPKTSAVLAAQPLPDVSNVLTPVSQGPLKFFAPPGILSLVLNAPTSSDLIIVGTAYVCS